MKPYVNSTVVTKGVMNGIRAELANVVTQSGQTCGGGADTVDEAFPTQVYMAIHSTAGSAMHFVTDGTASGNISLSRLDRLTNDFVLPVSAASDGYAYLDGFTIRFKLTAQKTSSTGSLYWIQFNEAITSNATLDAKVLADDKGTDLAIGRLPINKTIEAYYNLTAGKWYLTTNCAQSVLADTRYAVMQYRVNGAGSILTASTGSWSSYPLNVIQSGANMPVSFGGGQISVPAGTYFAKGSFYIKAATGVDIKVATRLWDSTNSVELVKGQSYFYDSDSSIQVVANANLEGVFTLAATTDCSLQYFSVNAAVFGVAIAGVTDNVYGTLTLHKIV